MSNTEKPAPAPAPAPHHPPHHLHHPHVVTLKDLVGLVIMVVVVLGGFAVFIIGEARATATTAAREVEAALAKNESAEHALIRAEVKGSRDDLRALYVYLLSGIRQPPLERPSPPISLPDAGSL